jgi:hypothetical protein
MPSPPPFGHKVFGGFASEPEVALKIVARIRQSATPLELVEEAENLAKLIASEELDQHSNAITKSGGFVMRELVS